MTGSPLNALFRRWWHSFEEDAGDVRVYRPADYAFPRARGRAGIEFRPDGTFVDWSIGPGDAGQGVQGQWHVETPGRLRVTYDDNIRAAQTLEIVHCDSDVLKVQQTSWAGSSGDRRHETGDGTQR